VVELGRLRLGERQPAGLSGDAVPEVLGELDALGKRELADVEVSGTLGLSLPRAPGGRNTREVDIGFTTCVPLTHRA
jgi:hypothetical protein